MAKLLINLSEWNEIIVPHLVLVGGATHVDVFGVLEALKAVVNAQGMPVTFRDEPAPSIREQIAQQPFTSDDEARPTARERRIPVTFHGEPAPPNPEAIIEPHDMDRGPVDDTGDGWGEVPPLTDAALQRRSLASDRYVE